MKRFVKSGNKKRISALKSTEVWQSIAVTTTVLLPRVIVSVLL